MLLVKRLIDTSGDVRWSVEMAMNSVARTVSHTVKYITVATLSCSAPRSRLSRPLEPNQPFSTHPLPAFIEDLTQRKTWPDPTLLKRSHLAALKPVALGTHPMSSWLRQGLA